MKTTESTLSPRVIRIRKRMIERGIKVTDLARQLEYTRQHIHRAFRLNDRPVLDKVERALD